MSRYESMSSNKRESIRENLQYSLSFKNRNEAPVWLRVALHRDLAHEAPVSGDQITLAATK